MSFGIRNGIRQAVLTGTGRLNLQGRIAPVIGVQIPAGHFTFHGLVVAIGNAQQFEPALAGNRVLAESLGLEAGVDCIADLVMAAIQPGIDLKRFAGHQHLALADNGSP